MSYVHKLIKRIIPLSDANMDGRGYNEASCAMGKQSKAVRRQRLFDLYSKNLSLYTKLTGQFMCPICLGLFGPEALEKPLQVDIAHVYPTACGGKPETLTCWTCNNRMGFKYDPHLALDHRTCQAFREDGNGKITARLYFDGGNVGGELTMNGGGFNFHIMDDLTNPKDRDALMEAARREGFKFQFRFDFADPRCATIGILHSAYLAMFREYGYEYIGFANTDWIREILLAENPPKEVPVTMIDIPPNPEYKAGTYSTGIVYLNGYKCLTATLPSPRPNVLVRSVLLPGLGEAGKREYEEIRKIGGHVQLAYQLSSRGLSEQRVKAPRGRASLHKFWYRSEAA